MSNIFSSKITNFEQLAVDLYRYQLEHNVVVRGFYQKVAGDRSIRSLDDIIYLPVSMFRDFDVISGHFVPELIFTSSGTTSARPSRHLVKQASIYRQSFLQGFRNVFGEPTQYTILGLLPSYLERTGSSLVYMVQELIQQSGNTQSGFYLNELDKLNQTLTDLQAYGKKVILFGVTYALIDYVARFPIHFPSLTVIDTGGMKGRAKEMIREEVHGLLRNGFGIDRVYSEYGMTELMSQAYSVSDGRYFCPPWMQVQIMDPTDPLHALQVGESGMIAIVDLANQHSCAFIQTADIGRKNEDGSFEVLGRMDNSDIRGCSLLYT